jgi:hypothetical protein
MIHSSIDVLDLNDYIGFAVPLYALLFDGMTRHESEIRLSKVVIRALDQTVVEALALFLPHSTRLQELLTSHLFSQTNYRLLLSAIRQNGSLCLVDEEPFPRLDHMWLKRVSAYCKRNGLVPKLLAQSQSDAVATDSDDGVLDICLVPTILFVAQQSPRMAPNILIGLLRVLCCDDDGSTATCGTKTGF